MPPDWMSPAYSAQSKLMVSLVLPGVKKEGGTTAQHQFIVGPNRTPTCLLYSPPRHCAADLREKEIFRLCRFSKTRLTLPPPAPPFTPPTFPFHFSQALTLRLILDFRPTDYRHLSPSSDCNLARLVCPTQLLLAASGPPSLAALPLSR